MQTTLPNEILEQVALAVLPSTNSVALPASDITTKTLLSLSLTCKLLSTVASRLLIRTCLYIDSGRRLALLLRALHRRSSHEINHNLYKLPMGMYLAPFRYGTLGDPDIADDIEELFDLLAPTLERLVIDISLRTLDPDDDIYQIRPVLRAAFTRLVALKEFCSIQDDLYLSTENPNVQPMIWASWPQLQRLALYNPDVSFEQFINGLNESSSISHVVVARADGWSVDLPDEYWRTPCRSLKRLTILYSDDEPPDRWSREEPTILTRMKQHLSEISDEVGPGGITVNDRLRQIAVRTPENAYPGYGIDLMQRFVQHHAILGSLWDLTHEWWT